MLYLYKVYDPKKQKYTKFIIINEHLWDSSNLNLIYVFKDLDEQKKEKLLTILNKKIEEKEYNNFIELVEKLQI